MDYRKYGGAVYIRMDKGDEIIDCILDVCNKERIMSATFSGIGGYKEAQVQTFLPDTGTFETETVCGMLELISLNGNIISDDGNQLHHHTHAMLSLKEGNQHRIAAGHIHSITVLYTAEIELRPVLDGVIKRKHDPETGTGFWCFD